MTDPQELVDSSKRLADSYTEILMRNKTAHVGRWVAFAMSDGRSNGTVYDSWKDARRYNLGPFIILQLQPGGIRERAARVILKCHRAWWDAGFRFGDPNEPEPVMTGANDPRPMRSPLGLHLPGSD